MDFDGSCLIVDVRAGYLCVIVALLFTSLILTFFSSFISSFFSSFFSTVTSFGFSSSLTSSAVYAFSTYSVTIKGVFN